jgi:hypothetical protein
MEGTRTDWENTGPLPLGEGGQSVASSVRNSVRQSELGDSLKGILQFSYASDSDTSKAAHLADCVWKYARPDEPSELGALKVFKIPPEKPRALSPQPGSKDYEAVETTVLPSF